MADEQTTADPSGSGNSKASNGTMEKSSIVACPFCREPIDAAAKLCKHCKSDLSWRRHIHISQITLALTTALIAVLAAVGPSIISLFKPDAVSLQNTVIGSTNHTVTMLITNRGKDAGAVSGLSVFIRHRTNQSWLDTMHLSAAMAPVVVKGGETVAISFLCEPDKPPCKPPDWAPQDDHTVPALAELHCSTSLIGATSAGQILRIPQEVECTESIVTFANTRALARTARIRLGMTGPER